MRVPLSWLREMADVDLEPEALAARLTMLGMEVKGIERRGTEWQNVVVGELLAVEKHPRADRLSLTRVTTGTGKPLEIVCGATNIAPGQKVPVALPGAVLPGGRRIERTEKMGVVSNGMLCSGDELGLTSDADGILILGADTPLGAGLADLYGDVVLDVDVKPNRGDALSIVGIAREVAAITGSPLRLPAIEVGEGSTPASDRLAISVDDERLCPRFVGRWVEGVEIRPSPDRIQMRLLAAGIRPVSNVVDASNYVMVELGKPTHAYDAAALASRPDGITEIRVRDAQDGETIETIDHETRALTPETLLITDARGPIGIAGVMGGAGTEVSETTRDVIVESAIFDPVSIRRTAFRYALRSEASLRFEKGQEFRLARLGADRASQLIVEWAGGTVARGVVDTHPGEPEPRRVAFRPARVDRLLGTAFGADAQREVLARVGIETQPAGEGTIDIPIAAGTTPASVPAPAAEAVIATVPTWRRDIEIEADLAEEVARVHGYEDVPPRLPATPMPAWRETPLAARDAIREALAGAGMTEAVTYALVSARIVEGFHWSTEDRPAAGETAREGLPITVTNPLSMDHAILRQSIVGSLVQVVDANLRHGQADVVAFEIGKGYGRVGDAPREWWRLGLALTGSFDAAGWNRPRRDVDIDDAKGAIELIARVIGSGAPAYRPLTDEPLLHPGRSASVTAHAADGSLAIGGVLGELHPRVGEAWDLRRRVVVAELSISGLAAGALPIVAAEPLPHVQPVERDLTVDIPDTVPASDVATTIRDAGGELLQEALLVGTYRGHPLGPDERSLTWRVRFGAGDRTLGDAEVDAAVEAVTGALRHQVGARIRS
jgi:phenylalanyl-tRNA synthetase beta chain